ncbi:MAG: efflux RND transporter permease subunit, partial [Stagnimonas sp.]|nr:efflux RND transporter permease subunit [Stagnimonas sp.]
MKGAAELGLSGRIARQFLTTEITPLLALTGLLLGLFAVLVTPREEEPQINVTFANVFIPFPGASAQEVESLLTTPAERIVSEIEKVEHVYSVSQPGMAVLTVRYEVGTPRTDAIVRLYNAFYQHADWLPQGLGVGPPLIKPKGIDDVPIVAVTLWSEDPQLGADDLMRVARSIDSELQRVPGTRNIEIIGGPERVLRVTLDPQRLTGYGLAIEDLRRALAAANVAQDADAMVRDNREILVQAGAFLSTPEDVAELVVGVRNQGPIFLRDVAEVALTADIPKSYVSQGIGSGA